MTWWTPGWRANWFALTATLLVTAACSETTAEAPRTTSTQAPSSAGPSVTVLEGHIVGDGDHPGYTVEVPDGWSTVDGGFIVKEDQPRSV
jgi:hypothetical protein